MKETLDRKAHWQKIYAEKDTQQVSWYQEIPQHSLDWMAKLELGKEAAILDVGAGDSRLPDQLLQMGYQAITVLDISAKALEKAQTRLGEDADKIKWIVSDVLDLEEIEAVALWHDRAAFHFLRSPEDIESYVQKAAQFVLPGGHLLIGSFSTDGPPKCSGLEIQQYSETSIKRTFEKYFDLLETERLIHHTPSGSSQEFLFALFRSREIDQ